MQRPPHTVPREPPGDPDRPDPDRPEPHETLEPLPPATRIAMWIVGCVFLVIGLVGLALPVIPQAVPLALGAAFLSLASERFYSALVRNVERWPRLSRRLIKLRVSLHRFLWRLHRRTEPDRAEPDRAEPEVDDQGRSSSGS